jgi:hypothetical protein
MGGPQQMGGPTPFGAAPPQPMGAPPMGAGMSGPMGMQPYNQAAQLSQQMASDITKAAANSTKRVMMIVVISIVASVVLGILFTVLAFVRSSG